MVHVGCGGEHAITVIVPGQGHEVVFLAGVAHDLVDLGERRFGKKDLVIAAGIGLRPMALGGFLRGASASCFRADHILSVAMGKSPARVFSHRDSRAPFLSANSAIGLLEKSPISMKINDIAASV